MSAVIEAIGAMIGMPVSEGKRGSFRATVIATLAAGVIAFIILIVLVVE